jgi:uncharacterized protein (DUF433 family)
MTASDEHTANTRKGLSVSDPAVMMGKPVIAGTRITVELILEELAASATPEQLLDAYPRFNPRSHPGCLRFCRRRAARRCRLPICREGALNLTT